MLSPVDHEQLQPPPPGKPPVLENNLSNINPVSSKPGQVHGHTPTALRAKQQSDPSGSRLPELVLGDSVAYVDRGSCSSAQATLSPAAALVGRPLFFARADCHAGRRQRQRDCLPGK